MQIDVQFRYTIVAAFRTWIYSWLENHAKQLIWKIKVAWEVVAAVVLQLRCASRQDSFLSFGVTERLSYRPREWYVPNSRVQDIKSSTWDDAVNDLAHMRFLFCFHITKKNISNVFREVPWSLCKTSTTHNKVYKTSMHTTTLILDKLDLWVKNQFLWIFLGFSNVAKHLI